MIRIIITVICVMNTFLLAEENKITGDELLKKSIDVSTPETMVSTVRQIVHFYTGRKREFIIKSWNKNGNDKMLFVYEKPARVKGDKFLFLKGGDIWVYFSKTGRIRRIASSARKSKMQGSDFSYEDISMISTMDEDFKSKIIKEEKFKWNLCYVVESVPKIKISYNKLINWIDKKTFVLRKIEYYKDNKLEKDMVQKDFKKMKGYYIPYTTIMRSIKNDTKTEAYMEKVKVNIKISDSKFNKNNLNR